MFHRKNNQTTDVPVGGNANYPTVGTPGAGYVDQQGNDVNMKPGYGYDPNARAVPQQANSPAYGGGYVQQTPVSYGPDGHPVHMKKKSNSPANWCAAAFIACWACTWPCHGPCCCGL